MKVDPIFPPVGQSTPTADMPLIKADDIKTILYLGIRGQIRLEPSTKHAVDTFA
jgi:hypothetical protein